MLRFMALVAALAGLFAAVSALSAAPLNKCVVNGTVTYQQGLCPSDQARKEPTVQDLNAAEKARRAAAASSPSTRITTTASSPVSGGFTCDGRTYCSQMTSCAEARYFLVNCAGVKMDGDRNGIPCEKQWCTR
ncbi:MAG: excalibur calcium-binding domain-containing protein [Burkholderiales bacterium]|nr:excalibur calcium-binding domain-containing protein [Burkholderiales bacterium]